MKQHLTATQSQQLALTQQLRQALAVLQMSATELETELASAVESNPLLEWAEDARPLELADPNIRNDPAEGAASAAPGDDDNWNSEDTRDEWRESGEDWQHAGGSRDDDDNPAERQIAEETLQDHLRWQLGLTTLSDRDQELGLALIDAIDDDGYLREPLPSIAETLLPETTCTVDEITVVLHQVQRFDPVGVGARDLGECLMLQLQLLSDDTPGKVLATRIVSEAIERLPKIGVEGLAAELRCGAEDAAVALHLVRSLDPRPGAQIGAMPASTYITPDCVITLQQGVWRVTLANERQTRLTIHRGYEQMIRHAGASDAGYLRGRLQEARWLIRSIEARGDTLLKVMHS